MKIIALALFALLAGANAVPSQINSVDTKDSRYVDDIVIVIIESIIDRIEQRGLDPYVLESAAGEYIVNERTGVRGSVENLLFTGLSNININDVSFSGGVLSVDLSAPRIAASVGNAEGAAWARGRTLNGQLSGSLAINDLRAVAEVSLGVSGYILEDLKLACSLGGIDSNLNINIQDRDVSDSVNRFLGDILPSFLNRHEELLNRIVARIVLAVFDRLT